MTVNGLDFIARDLVVRYQASQEPQELRIRVETSEAIQVKAALIALRGPFDWINFGAAGGAEFAPWEGVAREIGFEFGEERQVWGPNYDFSLRIQSVSHRFIRLLIESLRISGWGEPVRRMQIVGSLPIQNRTTSATEGEICEWVNDPSAYPEEWPEPGFPMETVESELGVTVEAAFATAPWPKHWVQMETLLALWPNVILNYLNDRGEAVVVEDISCRIPQIGRKKQSIVASYRHLPHARAPMRAALVNMLSRFHHAVAPIASVRIGM